MRGGEEGRMEPDISIGRISQSAFKGVCGAFFGLTLITIVIRLSIQLRRWKRPQLDGLAFVVACFLFVVATLLLFISIPRVYWEMSLVLGTDDDLAQHILQPDFLQQITDAQRLGSSYLNIAWTVVFATKVAWLCFFRQFVERSWNLSGFWWACLAENIVSWGVCASGMFIICPQSGLLGLKCVYGSSPNRELAVSIVMLALDIFTYLLLISIPIVVRRSMRIDSRQTSFTRAFNGSMALLIALAVVRFVGHRTAGNSSSTIVDIQWSAFWLQLEASIAVLAFSLTVLQSGLDGDGSSSSPPLSSSFSSEVGIIKQPAEKKQCQNQRPRQRQYLHGLQSQQAQAKGPHPPVPLPRPFHQQQQQHQYQYQNQQQQQQQQQQLPRPTQLGPRKGANASRRLPLNTNGISIYHNGNKCAGSEGSPYQYGNNDNARDLGSPTTPPSATPSLGGVGGFVEKNRKFWSNGNKGFEAGDRDRYETIGSPVHWTEL